MTGLYMCVLGRVFNKEWRLGVRRYTVGDFNVCPRTSVRRTDRWTGDRQLCALLPRGHTRWRRRHGAGGPWSAGQLPPRDLRPDGRVLEPRRVTEADVPRSTHVPAAEEHGLQRRWRASDTIQKHCSMRLTLWRPLLPYGYSCEASCARPG